MKTPKKLWLLLVLLHLAGFFYQVSERHLYLSDSVGYLNAAANILTDFNFYSDPPSQPLDLRAYTMRPPVYPLFLAALKLFLKSDLVVLLIQNLLSLLTFGLIFRFLNHRGFSTQKHSLLVGLVVLLYPTQIFYANLVMSETLFQLLLLLFFLALYRFLQKPDLKALSQAAGWLILCFLTKPVMYLFSFAFLTGCIYYTVIYRKKVFAVVGLLPVIVLLLYCSWNYQRTGFFHFSSIQEINLVQYNGYYLLQNTHGKPYADSTIKAIARQSATFPSYAEQQKHLRQAGQQLITQNLGAYVGFHLKGTLNFFIDPGRFDVYHFFGIGEKQSGGLLQAFSTNSYRGIVAYLKQQPVLVLAGLALIAVANLLKALVFIYFCLSPKFESKLRLLMAVLVFYLAFLTGPLGASRFAMPVFPFLLIAAVCVTEQFWYGRKHKNPAPVSSL